MDTITGDVLRQVATIVEEIGGDIHTVTLELNEAHGGVDVVVKGFPPDDTHEFEHKYMVH